MACRKSHSGLNLSASSGMRPSKSISSRISTPISVSISHIRPLFLNSMYFTMRELQYCHSASITSAHVSQLPHTAWQLPRSASFIIKRRVSRLLSPFSRKSPSMMSSSASEKLIFSRSPLK